MTRSFLDRLEQYHEDRREELNWMVEFKMTDWVDSTFYSIEVELNIRPYGIELDYIEAQQGGVGTGSANLRDQYNKK